MQILSHPLVATFPPYIPCPSCTHWYESETIRKILNRDLTGDCPVCSAPVIIQINTVLLAPLNLPRAERRSKTRATIWADLFQLDLNDYLLTHYSGHQYLNYWGDSHLCSPLTKDHLSTVSPEKSLPLNQDPASNSSPWLKYPRSPWKH
jgi:hypothetical protein